MVINYNSAIDWQSAVVLPETYEKIY